MSDCLNVTRTGRRDAWHHKYQSRDSSWTARL